MHVGRAAFAAASRRRPTRGDPTMFRYGARPCAMANAACKTKNPARFRPGFLHNRSTLPFLPRMALRHKRNQRHMSVAHELSGLGSTRVVRFSASVRRRINEPDNMATGPQDGEVL